MIEAQVHWVMQCIKRLRRDRLRFLDVRAPAQRRFIREVQRRSGKTVWTSGGCRSWYLDENGKNFTLWPGYTAEYWLRTRRLRHRDFEAA